MNWRARLAVWYIPDRERARATLDLFMRFALEHYDDLVRELGPVRAQALYTRTARQLGRELAGQLREQLKMDQGPSKALLGWRIGARLLGFRVRITETDDGVDFEHLKDPLWKAFCAHGSLLCQVTCIPLTESLAQALWPSSEVTLVREPTMERPCIKRLRLHPESS